MEGSLQLKGLRNLTRHVAARALVKSVLINLLVPALLYRVAAPHFPTNSLLPLALSGLPPLIWLAFTVVRLRAIDFLGLFAAENVLVSIAALVMAHTERGALIGRSMQNVILAALFLMSLATARPLVLLMARQLSTGNDPEKRRNFDLAATQPDALRAYQYLTLGWTVALLIKAGVSYFLGAHFSTKDFLIVSPLWDLFSDSLLVTSSILYGRAALAPPSDLKVTSLVAP